MPASAPNHLTKEPPPEYVLGHADHELERLQLQSQIIGGVTHVVDILRTELEAAMALTGRTSIAAIDRSEVWRSHFAHYETLSHPRI